MPAGVQQKVKLLQLYELLKQETDEDHPISRVELCRRLNEMGVSSNVRTLSKDIEELRSSGYEVMSFMRKWEKFYYLPEHDFSVPELKILIDAVQAASFISGKKTEELVGKIAMIGGSHRAELLRDNMVKFNTRKHTNETVLYTVDSIEDAIARRKKIPQFGTFMRNLHKEKGVPTALPFLWQRENVFRTPLCAPRKAAQRKPSLTANQQLAALSSES